MQQCVSLLGEPNLRQVYQRWPQNGEYAGARFYYVVRQEGVHLMPETDRHLRVYFDAKDQVKRVEWLGVSSP